MGIVTKDQMVELYLSFIQPFSIINPFMGMDYIYSLPVISANPRWLRFDPTNRKGLVVAPRTFVKRPNGVYLFSENGLQLDFSSYSMEPGKEYFVFLNNGGEFYVTPDENDNGGKCVGRFHTLCVSAGELTCKIPAAPSSGVQVGDNYLIKNYHEDLDPDFYSFYNREVLSVEIDDTYYDVVETEHPLSGYEAGDILPESVFCNTFYPDVRYSDAMVYEKETNLCVDVYFQTGMLEQNKSVYNGIHVSSRPLYAAEPDYNWVGKRLLTDAEFFQMSLGSQPLTSIVGKKDYANVGGHSDVNGKRMISAIGCEECCGFLKTTLSDIKPKGGSSFLTRDGLAKFGKCYGSPYRLTNGGMYSDASTNGPRQSSSAAAAGDYYDYESARGCKEITIKMPFTML